MDEVSNEEAYIATKGIGFMGGVVWTNGWHWIFILVRPHIRFYRIIANSGIGRSLYGRCRLCGILVYPKLPRHGQVPVQQRTQGHQGTASIRQRCHHRRALYLG
jgi:hypothetical protein